VGWRRPRVATAPVSTGSVAGALSRWGDGMPLSMGARFAWANPRGHRSWGSFVAGAVGIAALVASVSVGMTLTAIAERPARWGVNYDQLFGNPYTDVDNDIVAPIVGMPEVLAVTGANF